MLKVPLAGKSLGSTWSGMHYCGMQCGSFMAVSTIIVFKWPNKNRSKAPPWYFFSSDEIHNRDDQKISTTAKCCFGPKKKLGTK